MGGRTLSSFLSTTSANRREILRPSLRKIREAPNDFSSSDNQTGICYIPSPPSLWRAQSEFTLQFALSSAYALMPMHQCDAVTAQGGLSTATGCSVAWLASATKIGGPAKAVWRAYEEEKKGWRFLYMFWGVKKQGRVIRGIRKI